MKRVILGGGGHSHLSVLEDWRRNPVPQSDLILVTPHRHAAYSGMLPGWIEGIYQRDQLLIDLTPLAEAAGARLVLEEIVGLDADRHRVSLSSGDTLDYDVLSLATGGSPDQSMFSALAGSLVPVRPLESFVQSWEGIRERLADGSIGTIAVVGGGAAGAEIALAISASLSSEAAGARMILVAGTAGLLNEHSPGARRKVRTALAARGVSVIESDAVGEERGLFLSDGRLIAPDCIIVTTGSRPPAWLADSGLALGRAGGVAVGPNMRSVSHARVFSAGDVSERTDRTLSKSGVHAVKAGPILAANLRAAVTGRPLRRYEPRRKNLFLISTGKRHAILAWGGMAAQGRWVWRLKDRIDRRFVTRYRVTPGGTFPRNGSVPLLRSMAAEPVVGTALKVSFVVGTALNAINQGDELLNGQRLSWGRIALNYLVPFLVASYSGARARQAMRRSDR